MPALRLTHKCEDPSPPLGWLTLPFELRRKRRLRALLDCGREAALLLPQGTALRDGDTLAAEGGGCVRVRAAGEHLSVVACADPLLLARAAYHLGNRHVAVQVDPGCLRYLHDHVLDGMLRAMGLAVHSEFAPFEPEQGAYHDAGVHGHLHQRLAPP
ncbi:MAG: urease accessory protein UreE [Gammaproteobacteria bacterium]